MKPGCDRAASEDAQVMEASESGAGATRLPPAVLYHQSSPSNRESILADGLSTAFSETALLAKEEGREDWRDFGGLFFAALPGDGGGFDVWEVDVSGLDLCPDDTTEPFEAGDTWWVTWTDRAVGPERLKLFWAAEAARSPGR